MTMLELLGLTVLVLLAPLLLRLVLDWCAGRRSEARRARRPARDTHAYDGHADYQAEIESPQSRIRATGRSAFTNLMTFVAAVTGVCLTNWLFWPMGPDAENIMRVFAFVGMVLGFFSGMICYLGAVGVFPGHTERVALATVVLFVAAVWLLGERHEGVLEERARREASFRGQRADERQAVIAWRARIDELRLHGDSVPPMLSVESDGTQLRITNRSSTLIGCVEVRRVGSAGVNRVSYPLSTERGYPCSPIGRGSTLAYRDLDDAKRARYVLEFRIGRPGGADPTWWSDSALRQFDQDFELGRIYRIP
jgi:hypothetical protein